MAMPNNEEWLKGIKAQLSRNQVQIMSTSIPDRAVADLWAKLLSDYPKSSHFLLLAGGDERS